MGFRESTLDTTSWFGGKGKVPGSVYSTSGRDSGPLVLTDMVQDDPTPHSDRSV